MLSESYYDKENFSHLSRKAGLKQDEKRNILKPKTQQELIESLKDLSLVTNDESSKDFKRKQR